MTGGHNWDLGKRGIKYCNWCREYIPEDRTLCHECANELAPGEQASLESFASD